MAAGIQWPPAGVAQVASTQRLCRGTNSSTEHPHFCKAGKQVRAAFEEQAAQLNDTSGRGRGRGSVGEGEWVRAVWGA